MLYEQEIKMWMYGVPEFIQAITLLKEFLSYRGQYGVKVIVNSDEMTTGTSTHGITYFTLKLYSFPLL